MQLTVSFIWKVDDVTRHVTQKYVAYVAALAGLIFEYTITVAMIETVYCERVVISAQSD